MKMEENPLPIVYAYTTDTGEYVELNGIAEINIDSVSESPDIPMIGGMEVTLKLKLQPKSKMHLLGMTNNCIRLHGGRPIRTIPDRFL